MKTEDIKNILCGADDETAARLSHGAMTDEEKERIFAMSKKKLNDMDRNFVSAGDQVSGVERDTRPAWRRYAGIAAALVVGVGALGGSGLYLLRGMGNNASQGALIEDEAIEVSDIENDVEADNAVEETDAEEATYAEIINESEEISDEGNSYTETLDLTEEYQFQVNRLTKAYIDYAATIYGRGLEVDKSAAVEKIITDISGSEQTVVFYPVVDDRYRSWDDVITKAHAIFEDDLADDIIENWSCLDESEVGQELSFFYRNGDKWYIQAFLIDEKLPIWDPQWIEDEPVVTVNEDGTLSTTLTHYLYDSDDILSTDFVIGQVDNGMSDNWRILSYKENMIENEE